MLVNPFKNKEMMPLVQYKKRQTESCEEVDTLELFKNGGCSDIDCTSCILDDRNIEAYIKEVEADAPDY